MAASTNRDDQLRHILNEHRREVETDVRNRVRETRTDRPKDVQDSADSSHTYAQGDLDLALLQLRSETLARIDAAVRRLDAGKYGTCTECDESISERRLRALPFAVRCAECEEQREDEQDRSRRRTRVGDTVLPFTGVAIS